MSACRSARWLGLRASPGLVEVHPHRGTHGAGLQSAATGASAACAAASTAAVIAGAGAGFFGAGWCSAAACSSFGSEAICDALASPTSPRFTACCTSGAASRWTALACRIVRSETPAALAISAVVKTRHSVPPFSGRPLGAQSYTAAVASAICACVMCLRALFCASTKSRGSTSAHACYSVNSSKVLAITMRTFCRSRSSVRPAQSRCDTPTWRA